MSEITIHQLRMALMKRSTSDILYISPGDMDLVLKGRKTATSRLGDRTDMWPKGKVITLASNGDDRMLYIEITYNDLMDLGSINDTKAGTIGDYDSAGHYADFVSIYPDADRTSGISLVGFYVL
jgi:hypothetical protein